MTQVDERTRFRLLHPGEPVQITVLTGERTGGAGRPGGAELWTASADVLAHVDEHGDVETAPGHLSWLVSDEERGPGPGSTWIHALQPLTQYVLRVRRAEPDPKAYAEHGFEVPDLSNHFALDEVLERDIHVPALDEGRERRTEPAEVTTDLGDFELDDSREFFEGDVGWRGRPVGVSLAVDEDAAEGSETCVTAFERLRAYVAEVEATDETWRTFAASTLEPAGDWLRDSARAAGLAEPTIESIAHGLRLSELAIEPDGSASAYYGDEGLFRDLAIAVEIDPDGTPTDAHVSG